jgi:hypothetical protein
MRLRAALCVSATLALATVARPARAEEALGASRATVDVTWENAMGARLVSDIEGGKHPLLPTIRFTTPGIAEESSYATGLTLDNVVRLAEVGRPAVFFHHGRIIVDHVDTKTRLALKDALAHGDLTAEITGPDATGMGMLELAGKLDIRTVSVKQLGYGVAIPRLAVGRALLRVPIKLDGIRGYFERKLAFHSGPVRTPVRAK